MIYISKSMFHTHILSDQQKELLPLLKLFRRNYYLVGGTAIALNIGHRRSVDYDLFTHKKINRLAIKRKLSDNSKLPKRFGYEDSNQIHLKINDVKLTFFSFPYSIPATVDFNEFIRVPALLDLAAMKAFAFAERAKWKDYVDMYFLLKNFFTVNEISCRTEELFNLDDSIVFTKKLFLQQLTFFKDIDYSEPIEFVCDPVSEDEIKNFLTDIGTSSF